MANLRLFNAPKAVQVQPRLNPAEVRRMMHIIIAAFQIAAGANNIPAEDANNIINAIQERMLDNNPIPRFQ